MHERFIEQLQGGKTPVVRLSGTLEQRMQKASEAIEKVIKRYRL
jgi:hypothetical protein